MNRESLNIVVVGHVDHGKSTLIGRLLFDTDSLPSGAIEKVKRISQEKGKGFEYSYLLDAFEEEQKQGITIDTTRLQFKTEKRDYIIIDAPGHKEFLKNMISGAASAESAILMVDANEGIQEQSKRHGYILSLLGIQKVYVAVNKMDLVDYSEEKYEEIKRDFDRFLNTLGVYPLKYIPVSAFHGENIASKSDKMPWYEGESILEAMDIIEKEVGIEDQPLRFPIQDVYKFDHRRIIAGRIESGSLKVGDEIVILPSNKTTKVKSIEHWVEKDKKEEVSAGMSVGIIVEDEFFYKRGEIVSHKDNIPTVTDTFGGNLFWLGKDDLVKNKKYKLKLATLEIECEIAKINKVIDASTLETIENGERVKRNDVAEITITTKEPIALDEFKNIQSTGRFVIVDDLDVSGGGIITKGSSFEVEKKFKSVDGEVHSVRPRLVTRQDREKRLGATSKVVWLTGKAGCGKREIAVNLEKELFDSGKNVYYLDYYQVATNQNDSEGIKEVTKIANILSETGSIVIVTSNYLLREEKEYIKSQVGKENFVEVYVEASDEVCAERFPSKEAIADLNEKSKEPFISLYIDDPNFDGKEKANSLLNIIF
ncbi:sulfate adenylyltransferase subunit 1 [Gottschalkia acidurici 9a]|uniref:sulfate adenylyltransferase n=1 Tax=Gottschalkia acidurici (strain ATCC 7906 / DSM 604 / BCRC 14475 / CIP 104303 / KCTC 5404 / NCIMB 10678 / 9a) TaxID=1128398 RepID=K0B217_GOTA9|nr:GTP-binding protein [Gottschalkia acidurici]AFS79514.1 sulfate adenylyltransferase subunit 1 [Gottschalkia acidurici 9a]